MSFFTIQRRLVQNMKHLTNHGLFRQISWNCNLGLKKNLPIKLQQVIKKGLFTQRHSIEKYLHKPQTKMGSPLVLILFGLVIATSQVSAQVAWGSAGLATKLIFPYRFFAKIINLPEGQIQHYFTLIVNCIKQTESNWFSDQVERWCVFRSTLGLCSSPWVQWTEMVQPH